MKQQYNQIVLDQDKSKIEIPIREQFEQIETHDYNNQQNFQQNMEQNQQISSYFKIPQNSINSDDQQQKRQLKLDNQNDQFICKQVEVSNEIYNELNEPDYSNNLYQNIFCKKYFFGLIKIPLSVELLAEQKWHSFCNQPNKQQFGNKIRTNKYTLLSFLPKNIIEQFSKLANIYFLIMGLLQMYKKISNTNGTPTIFAPLLIILIISMLKDIFEDLKRYRSDKKENNHQINVYQNGKFVKACWRQIKVGHIIKLMADEYSPADILILSSSEKKGVCFIETKNLDGETNLKHKQAKAQIFTKIIDENLFNSSYQNFFCNYEGPNPYLVSFNGTFNLDNNQQVPLDNQNFMLRGCSLKNTKWIIGLVLYTGHQTKIMLNSVKSRPKKSHLEKGMNFQIVVCLIAALISLLWFNSQKNTQSCSIKYIYSGNYNNQSQCDVKQNQEPNFILKFLSWMLNFANFVPISLLVTLETVKFIQATFIQNDENLKCNTTGMKAKVQSSNLNEELGQIQYIFSDKTGTLTCNIMDFKCITVGQISYGENRMEDISARPKVTNVDFKDKNFFVDMQKNNEQQSFKIKECLFFLATCHSIITEKKNDIINYNASSPDELALVNFAKFTGVEFIGIDEFNFIEVNFQGSIIKYKLLHLLEFNSDRKRMSVILKNTNNEIVLYCKGADSVIFERLSKNNNKEQQNKAMKDLQKYAQQGLRTLMLAQRTINNEEYNNWDQQYHQARTSLDKRDEKMAALQEKIEVELQLIGVTAIEDKLQDEVGPTIQILKDANINIWVLTGDKVETAINIGYSCQLLNDDIKRIEIEQSEIQILKQKLKQEIQNIQEQRNKEKVCKTSIQRKYGLVISGIALIPCMKEKELKDSLIEISNNCQVVLACRVSPKQKQEMVSMVREIKPTAPTLAIGDGANDVNMITAAHVGIGISGLEGQQAARASDYAIGEFKILRRLLLYVGRESYRKNSHLILYNFWKNMMLVFPTFWYGIYNGFSGQILYDVWIFQLYNMCYTAFPIISYALMDEEYPTTKAFEVTFKGSINKNPLEMQPYYYNLGQNSKIFNGIQFWIWMTNGVWHAAVICYFSILSLQNVVKINGQTSFFVVVGMMIFTQAVYLGNIKIVVFSKTFNPLSLFLIIGSILFYFITFFALSSISPHSLTTYNNFQILFKIPHFYFGTFLILSITILMDFALRRFNGQYIFLKNIFILIKECMIQ